MDARTPTAPTAMQTGQAGKGPASLRADQTRSAGRHLAQLPVALRRIELDAQTHAAAFRARRRPWRARQRRACANCCIWRRPTMPTGTGCSAASTCRILRRAVWNALVELEALLDRPRPVNRSPLDLDLDGCDEFFFGNEVRRRSFATTASVPFTNWTPIGCATISATRWRGGPSTTIAGSASIATPRAGHHGEGIASAHDRVNFRHPVSPEDLDPDAVARVLFVDRQNGQPVQYRRPSVHGARAELSANGIGKTISIDGNRLTVEYKLGDAVAPLANRDQPGHAELRRISRPLRRERRSAWRIRAAFHVGQTSRR